MADFDLQKLLQQKMTRKEFLGLSAIAAASAMGITGLIRELQSHASTPTASLEPENGTLSGGAAAVVTDTSASGSKAIMFNAGSGSTYTRPSGAGYARYEDMGTTDVRTAFHNTPANQNLTWPAGTFSFSNFNDPQGYHDGVRLTKTNAGFSGSGVDKTIFEMVPNTGNYTAPTATGSTNEAYLMALFTDSTAKPAVVLQGFTLQGTAQAGTPYYHGMRLAYTQNAIVRNVNFISAAPGYAYFPPGETFALGLLRTNGTLIENCYFDGAGNGASPFGANFDTNITLNNVTVTSTAAPNKGMCTFWATTGITTHNLVSTNNHNGINHEECASGPIRHYNPTLKPDRTISATTFHMSFNATTGNNTDIEIHWDGVPAPLVNDFPGANGAFCFVINNTYSSALGSGQSQTSMPRVYLNGDLLTIVDVPANKPISSVYPGTPDPTKTCFRFHQ